MDFIISPKVFQAIADFDIHTLCSILTTKELRPILPSLVRMSLIAPPENVAVCFRNRKQILKLLSSIECVNSIVALLSIDFHGLEVDVKQEQQLRRKVGSSASESVLVPQFTTGMSLTFERSDSSRRLRLVLYEILITSAQIHECLKNPPEFFIRDSDLFNNAVYVPDICDVINIALAELPALVFIQEFVQILLHVQNGPDIICWITANFPDHFNDVCISLIVNSERIEDENGGSRIRMMTLTKLCRMNPTAAYLVRSKCVELCKMAALTITLTLEFPHCFSNGLDSSFLSRGGDIVPFISGLLLGTDQYVRNWFTLFTRTRPKRNRENNVALQIFREELLYQLKSIYKLTKDNYLPDSWVVYCTILLRLYCALRGIAGLKFQDDEYTLLVKLVTTYPPATPEGVRYVSVAVCTLFACPLIINQQENELKCIQWLKWLSGTESPFFGKPTDVTTSFSEMLLLLAIHLHSNQLVSVSDLVCSTLGMKVSIRTHNMARIKMIFIQEVFSEQVVTSRAVKVLVTPNLSANITGFLPIHCIHQLMKSRAFTKHKVNVKDWIYKQICASVAPLHPLLPPLIEVYINSMLSITCKAPYECVSNEPVTEDEIMLVFAESSVNTNEEGDKNLMPQLLLLYYILMYEDVRLSNMQTYVTYNKQVKAYSSEFLSEFPIRFLLQQAQKDPRSYAGLFSSLLRLLIAHFPHLAIVEDWLEEEELRVAPMYYKPLSDETLSRGLEMMSVSPSQASLLLSSLLTKPPTEMWRYVSTFIKYLRSTLDDNVPRYIQELYRKVWLRFNTVLPRSLWIMTVKSLLHEDAMLPQVNPKQEKIIIDPLQILRCDTRVFRSAAVLSIVIRVLQSSLAASRSQVIRHLLDRPLVSNAPTGVSVNDCEREELKNALIATQESTAIQILIEACLETETDKQCISKKWALCEIRSVICSYLHQTYIADPSLAKIVQFQCYPDILIPVLVRGVPSMHICVDFITELISQPSLEQQVFAADLISHLAMQYAIPHSMNVARLVINTLNALLTVLPTTGRTEIFTPSLSTLVRTCIAFPPVITDVLLLLMQLGRICISDASLNTGTSHKNILQAVEDYFSVDNCSVTNYKLSNEYLIEEIVDKSVAILAKSVFKRNIYNKFTNYTGKVTPGLSLIENHT